MEVAGTVFAVVSLSIQLADGARKGFDLFESAYHANEECRLFAVQLAIEHDRFERWAEASGLTSYGYARRGAQNGGTPPSKTDRIQSDNKGLERYIRFNGNIIIPLLSEIHLIMGQLSGSEGRYSRFINFDGEATANNHVADPEPVVVAASQVADITEPIKPVPTSEVARNGMAKSLSNLIRAQPRRLDSKTTNNTHTPSEPRNQILSRLTKSTRVLIEPKRLRWAFRDKHGAQSKIIRVRELNYALQESLGHSQMQILVAGNEQFKAMLMQVLGAVDEMKGTFLNLKALQSAEQVEPATQQEPDSASMLTGSTFVAGQEVAVPAPSGVRPTNNDFMSQAAGFMLEVLDRSTRSCSRHLSREYRAEMVAGMPFDGGLRLTATLPGERHVWIEWKPYTPETVSTPSGADHRINPDTIARMDRLVSLLQIPTKPSEFCVPPCLGYFQDEIHQRLGVVYEPPLTSAVKQPRSLLSVFKMGNMPLSIKVHIAQRLSQWLFHLHSVRWLHKSIRSSSIIFFSEEGSRTLGDPYITGFGYARSANSIMGTTKPPDDGPWLLYVHPYYFGARAAEGYRKIYDIYSLGIVLIELALWKPMHEILGYVDDSSLTTVANLAGREKASTITVEDIADLRDEMLNGDLDILEQVRSLAGDKYHDAVKACIQGMQAFGLSEQAVEADTAVSADLLESFNSIVIEPMKSIVV